MDIFSRNTKRPGVMSRVLFCEAFDQRVLRAAHTLNQHRLAKLVLLGNADQLDRAAVANRTDLKGMDIIDSDSAGFQKEIKTGLAHGNTAGLDTTDPVVAGAWVVKAGLADVVMAGAATTSTHVMRVYLKVLGMAPDCKTMSGLSLVAFDNCSFVRHRIVGLADVSVVPDPTVEQLADIAIQSASSYERITGELARVAFMSFSTGGSSSHPAALKIAAAVALTRSRRPQLAVDGEMQIDAALVPSVAGLKSPSSSVAGNANVLVFPSLDAGNITVKIFQKFSHFRVIGPILQGISSPASYIPRGSSAEDIVDQVRLLTS